MTYNVFGGTLNLAQSIIGIEYCQKIREKVSPILHFIGTNTNTAILTTQPWT